MNSRTMNLLQPTQLTSTSNQNRIKTRSNTYCYWYRGLEKETVPHHTTHVIVHNCVTTIKARAFWECEDLVSVSMGDNVTTIEKCAFGHCLSLKIVRLSKILQYIGYMAFYRCESLEFLVLPLTINRIESCSLWRCPSLRLLILPETISTNNVCDQIINGAAISRIALAAGVQYEYTITDLSVTDESVHKVNNWLAHHMDDAPFHKLCYNADVTTLQINMYLNDNGVESSRETDDIHGMTPLHMLSMNPHAPENALAGNLLHANMEAAFWKDKQGKTPLDYAVEYNVPGLLKMFEALCLNHLCHR